MQIKLLSFQPTSLYENGGAGRVLRRLYDGYEDSVTALYVTSSSSRLKEGLVNEVSIPIFPIQKRWMRWHLRTLASVIRDKILFKSNVKKILRAALDIEYDVIHVINHGPYSALFCDHNVLNKPLWVSFHDHFSTCSTFQDTNKLWMLAERRLMISKELGLEYQRLFGNKEFEIITDGVLSSELSTPKIGKQSPVCIYFAGLLHIDYLPLFRVLADAMDLINTESFPCKLVLRGTQKVDFLSNRNFEVEYKQGFVSDEAIKIELDEADLLYLPIKFTLPDFYLYSLSTKMVGYLGASGAILYHGPEDSAACNLLTQYQASENCTSYNVLELKGSILNLLKNRTSISSNAKQLAKDQFDMLKLRDQFWNERL